MSKQETVSIAAAALRRATHTAKFDEVLQLWLSMVYDTAYLVALDKHAPHAPPPLPNTLPDMPLPPKKLPKDIFATENSGCYLCGVGSGGKVTGYVCMQPNCPTRVSC